MVLSEFRIALNEEIEAARRHESSSAVPLINGRRIAQIGWNYQYIFQIENVLNLPGDAPGDLYLPNRPPLNIIIISVDGLSITISIAEDIGVFVPTARLQSNLAHLMRKLIERIEAYGDKINFVGERIRGALQVSGTPLPLSIADLNEDLNEYQITAVSSALGYNTTFIWGPPGTGKTQTIGEIGTQLYKKHRSVLVVSHTNIAVDQAILHIAKKNPDELEKGHILRVGDPKDPQVYEWPELLLQTHIDRRAEELTTRRQNLLKELNVAIEESLEASLLISIVEWLGYADSDICKMDQDLRTLQEKEELLDVKISEFKRLADLKIYWIEVAEEAGRIQKIIVESENIENAISSQSITVSRLNDELTDISKNLAEAQAIYDETTSVGLLTRLWRRLPKPEEQKLVVDDFKLEMGNLGFKLDQHRNILKDTEEKYSQLIRAIDNFKRKLGNPVDILCESSAYHERFNQLNEEIRENKQLCNKTRIELEDLFEGRLLALKGMNLTGEVSGPAETMLNAIKISFEHAKSSVVDLSINELKIKLEQINSLIKRHEIEIKGIGQALEKIEDLIISEASIIATTLTRAYLRDSIQSRRFDTVILDEASMAPIPALWVAAGLADSNAVVVGDPKQLPPIVMSNHDLAKTWLGSDIFEVNGLTEYGIEKPYLVKLRTQYRMHPQISSIVNELIYERMLKDGELKIKGQCCNLSDDKCNQSLLEWYDIDWGHDNPVLLIDMGSADAWVTSVSRGNRASRLNFLSATISVYLAEQILKDGRKKTESGHDPRILMICPYRPHAKLLELLIRDQNLNNEARAGTIHNFQGSEADVVILDLVNDEPHFRVGMFIPALDDITKRLINVAVTRAKRRLFIIGDFDYIEKLSKKAFLGSRFIPYIKEHFPKIEAVGLIPNGLGALSAKAQSLIYGGEVEPDADRIVVTQDNFYAILRNDIAKAKQKIIIYSAFITIDRLSSLEPSIRGATERGVRFYVITKALGDRGKRDLNTYRMLERALEKWGVIIIHKRNMHEKLIFIDGEILWIGSLNTLSFSDTQEIMERRVSQSVFNDYVQTLKLNELINEYEEGYPKCPICGSEVVASEGNKEPYYWRCIQENCYRRSIDQPRIEGGKINCQNCAGKVE